MNVTVKGKQAGMLFFFVEEIKTDQEFSMPIPAMRLAFRLLGFNGAMQ